MISFTVRVWGTLTSIPDCKHRSGHHEDDEQHEHDIHQWRDVGCRQASVRLVRPLALVKAISGTRLHGLGRLPLDEVEHFEREVVIAGQPVREWNR